MLHRAALLFVVVLGAFCVATWFVGDVLAMLVFGSRYAGHGTLITVLALATLADALGITAVSGLWVLDRAVANLRHRRRAITGHPSRGGGVGPPAGRLGHCPGPAGGPPARAPRCGAPPSRVFEKSGCTSRGRGGVHPRQSLGDTRMKVGMVAFGCQDYTVALTNALARHCNVDLYIGEYALRQRDPSLLEALDGGVGYNVSALSAFATRAIFWPIPDFAECSAMGTTMSSTSSRARRLGSLLFGERSATSPWWSPSTTRISTRDFPFSPRSAGT